MQTNIKGSYLYWHHFAVNQAEPRPDGAGPLLSRCSAGLQAARQAHSTLSAAFCNWVFQYLEPPLDTFPASGSISVLLWWIATRTRETAGGKRLQPLRCCVVIFSENLDPPPFEASCYLHVLGFADALRISWWARSLITSPTFPLNSWPRNHGCFIEGGCIKC